MAITKRLIPRLRDKITLQAPTHSTDTAGGPTITYTDLAVRKASIEPLNGSELFTAQQFHSEVRLRVRTRFDSVTKTLTPRHRVVYDSRNFDIIDVINPQNRNKEIVLMCSEVV